MSLVPPLGSGAPDGSSSRASVPLVRLLDGPRRPAATPVERLAVRALERDGVLPYPTLVLRVADDLYREELRRGGWNSDIGVWGSRLFVPEVERELGTSAGLLRTTAARAPGSP